MEIFQKGETAYYHEMGAMLKVEVLESTAEGDFVDYRLMVTEILRDSSWKNVSFKIGQEFECTDNEQFKTSPLKAFRMSRNL